MEKQTFPIQITTERLILKQHTLDHAQTMFSYVDKDRERLRRFLPWVDFTKTLDDERSYIQMTLDKWQACELFDYGLYRIPDHCYLGNAGVHTIA